MAGQRTAISHAPITTHAGTPIVLRTETTAPATTPTMPNPYSFEFWTPILAFAMLVSGVLALLTNGIKNKIKEAQDNHKPVHDQVDKAFHRLANESATDRARIHALEAFRQSDVERIVRLETNLHAIERSQERIEDRLEKMERDGKEGRAEIIDSIRELREVRPKT